MRRMMTIGILVVALAGMSLVACQPVRQQAESAEPRGVEGKVFTPSIEPWGGVAVSMEMDVTETDPQTHAAAGTVNWRNFQPNPPAGEGYWKEVESDAKYIFFGSDDDSGDPNTVVLITQIKSKDGWGLGEPGEYAYFWLRDGDDGEPDQWGMRYYSLDPWAEFFPAGEPPVEAGYFTVDEMQADDPVLPLDFEIGDVEITQ